MEKDMQFLQRYKPAGGKSLTMLFIGTLGADVPGIFAALQSALKGRLVKKGKYGGYLDELTVIFSIL